MTLGEYRVGIDFNPSGDPHVTKLKQLAADFIDACERAIDAVPASKAVDGEFKRLMALAMTHAEDAAMWAVKAVTKKPRTS